MLRLGLCMVAMAVLACAPPARLRLLSPMPEEQKKFLAERLRPFEKKNRVAVEIVSYREAGDLPRLLALRDSVPDLVELPSEAAPVLIRERRLKALDSALGEEGRARWRREFFLTEMLRVEARLYLLPRFLETRVLVYSRARARAAARNWDRRREEVEAALARHGLALPDGYALEEDPGAWDLLDLFVAGWTWKSQEARGARRGRIACPEVEGPEAALALWDFGLRLGADSASLARMEGPAVHALFQWQAAFAQEGLCHPATRGEDRASLLELFSAGEVFAAETHLRMAWRLHGNASAGLGAAAADPLDLGFAPLPGGGASTRVWWLAVPAASPSPDLALKLAEHLSAARSQIEECAGFGLIPARRDLLADLGLLYGGEWMEQAFRASVRQLVANRDKPAPLRAEHSEIARLYLEAYRQLCTARRPQSPQDIARALDRVYAPRARQILGESPEGLSEALPP